MSRLNKKRLQEKLDLLVRMSVLEQSRMGALARRDPAAGEDGQDCPSYSIHPAVRDGFLSGISRDAKEVLCWSYLVEAQHAAAKANSFNGKPKASASDTAPADASGSSLNAVRTALEAGLKIARDCGLGTFHIDLLLTRARLHLIEGHAAEAPADIRLALDEVLAGPWYSGFVDTVGVGANR